MSNLSTLQLDSYRLAQYTVSCPCYICGGGNNFDSELCRHCQAPMALGSQAAAQKIRPQMVAVIGSSGAGKTVYLGILADILSRQYGGMQMLARGAFSISLQQSTMAALARCEFPVKTPNEPERWNWVHCQLLMPKRRRPVELILPDLAGEALMEELDHPNSYPVVRSFLQKCSGLMVLVDAASAVSGEKDEDFYTMKLASYLCELAPDPRQGWPARPISFVFTKADECERCFEQPDQFARRHTPGLWQLSQERFRRHAYFATSVVGACAWRNDKVLRYRVPLRIEPRGIVEPFRWLIEQVAP